MQPTLRAFSVLHPAGALAAQPFRPAQQPSSPHAAIPRASQHAARSTFLLRRPRRICHSRFSVTQPFRPAQPSSPHAAIPARIPTRGALNVPSSPSAQGLPFPVQRDTAVSPSAQPSSPHTTIPARIPARGALNVPSSPSVQDLPFPLQRDAAVSPPRKPSSPRRNPCAHPHKTCHFRFSVTQIGRPAVPPPAHTHAARSTFFCALRAGLAFPASA